MSTETRLVLAHWTMPDADMERRCRAAAAGGFAGIGILPGVYSAWCQAGRNDRDLDGLLERYGVGIMEMESLSVAGPDSEAEVDASLEVHWHLAERFGADRLGIVVRPGHPRAYQLERFGRICDEAARRGVRVGIEFIPGVAAFEDINATLAFVEESGRANAGLIVDSYHHFRGADEWSQLENLPGRRVVIVQLSDAAIPPDAPDYVTDTMHHRRPPGQGDFPLARFLRVLDQIGSDAPISLEVLSDELTALTAEEQGQALGGATRALLAQVHGRGG